MLFTGKGNTARLVCSAFNMCLHDLHVITSIISKLLPNEYWIEMGWPAWVSLVTLVIILLAFCFDFVKSIDRNHNIIAPLRVLFVLYEE